MAFVLVGAVTEILPGVRLVPVVSDTPGTRDLVELTLVTDTPTGQVVVAGCSHPGIEKVLEAVTEMDASVRLLVGGIHLVTAPIDEIMRIAAALRDTWKVQSIALGHCTGELASAGCARSSAMVPVCRRRNDDPTQGESALTPCHNPAMDTELRERLVTLLHADRSGAMAAYVFGSIARGEATSASDVDVAVLWDRMPAPTLSGERLELESALERELGRSVDVVALNTAPADLVHRILCDGLIVLDRDPARRIQFEVARRNEYFDLEPMRRLYRREPDSRHPEAR